MDFKGPLKGRNSYMLVIIDEFSQFPFAFPCRNISTKAVMCCLDKLFCVFEFPSYIYIDRRSSFISHELKSYLRARGIASSRSIPYHPRSNGQCERCVQTVWPTIKLKLHERSLSEKRWEDVLPESLHAIRSLVCLASNKTSHNRMFKFNRRSMTGVSMPAWLLKEGPVYLCKFIRNKSDSLCERVYLLNANPSYAHVRLSTGNETTVSTSDLAPVPENAYFENENNLLIASPDATPLALLTNGEKCNMPSVVVDQLTAEAVLNNLPSPSVNKTIDVDAVEPSVVIPRRSERIRRHPKRFQAEKLGEWVK